MTMLRWSRPALAALALGLALTLGSPAGGAAATPAELLGTWDLVTLQATGGPVEDTTGAGLTLIFAADGRVSGQGGCNGFGGTAGTDDRGRLQLVGLASTLRACAVAARTARETRYFATLQEARGYTLDGPDTLRLGFDAPGRQLVFRRAGGGGTGGMPGLPQTGTGGLVDAAPNAGPRAPGAALALASGVLLLLGGAVAGRRLARSRGAGRS